MSTPQFKDTLGNLYIIPGATPVPPPLVPPTAFNTGNILSIPGWKMEHDSGTPGTASNISMKVNTDGSALFSANQTKKGGVRWSVTAASNVPDTILNYCYDITLQFPDPSQQACLEMDINHVDSSGNIYFLCVQASHYSKSYEYSLKKPDGSIGWFPSAIKVDPLTFLPNTDKHIRIITKRTTAGIVSYVSVEEDGIINTFAASNSGPDTKSSNWTKKILLPNFQLDGANDAGLMRALVKNLNISYW